MTKFAVDRDPALEALLYEPDRNAPLPDNFYRAAIAGGSIVPPISGARARYEDSRIGIIAIVVGLCLVAAGITAFIWRV